MKNRRFVLLLVAFFIALAATISPSKADAYDYVPSALLQKEARTNVQQNPTNLGKDIRAQVLQKYLEKYKSPLAPYSKVFIEQADKNKIDWRWVAAISGVESYYGQYIPPSSFNGWGFGVYGNNVRRFGSWEEAITTVSQALREEYMDKRGAQNIYQIGSTYAADPAWAGKVVHFMSDIDTFAEAYQDPNVSLPLSF